MNMINLTPHNVNFNGEVIKPDGTIARLESKRVQVDNLPLFKTVYGQTIGLPNEIIGRFIIVSAMVRSANPNRKDLISPGSLIRDEKGNVIGCKDFDCNL